MRTFIRLHEVKRVTGLARSTIYEGIRKGWFPKAIKLGPKAVAWDAEEITKYQNHRMGLREINRSPKPTLPSTRVRVVGSESTSDMVTAEMQYHEDTAAYYKITHKRVKPKPTTKENIPMGRYPRTVNQYSHITPVLDYALANGGAQYRLARPGLAIQFRQQAYSCRSLLRKMDQEKKKDMPGVGISTIYDRLILKIDPVDKCLIHVEILEPVGQIMDKHGKPAINIPSSTDLSGDEMLQEAEDLLRGLKL